MPTPFDDEVARQLRRMPAIRANTIAEILALLQTAETAIAGELGRASVPGRVKLLQQQAAVRAAMERFQAAANDRMQSRLGEAWRAGTELWREPAKLLDLGIVPRIGDRTLLAMRTFLTDRIKDLSLAAVNRINRTLGEVLVGTLPASEAIDRVMRQLSGSTRKRASLIVYDNIGRAYSAASYETMLAAEQSGIAIGKRWLKSGKTHPRPAHVAAHNQIVRVSEPFLIGNPKTGQSEALRYPRDEQASIENTIHCGCIAVPVVDGTSFGAGVVLIPKDPGQKIRVVSRAEYAAQSEAIVDRVDDRLARYLRR